MNARTVQIDFDEATPVALVALHLKFSTGARSGDIKEINLDPKPGYTAAGAFPEDAVPISLFLAAEKLASGHAHPIRWGINE